MGPKRKAVETYLGAQLGGGEGSGGGGGGGEVVLDVDGGGGEVVLDVDGGGGGGITVWQLAPPYPALHAVHVHDPVVPPTVPPLMQ